MKQISLPVTINLTIHLSLDLIQPKPAPCPKKGAHEQRTPHYADRRHCPGQSTEDAPALVKN